MNEEFSRFRHDVIRAAREAQPGEISFPRLVCLCFLATIFERPRLFVTLYVALLLAALYAEFR